MAFPGHEDDVSNYCSGIFNSSLGIGQICGPLFGSNVAASMGVNGFRYTQDIAALVNFVYGFLYFSMANGPEAFASLSAKNRKIWQENQVREQQIEIFNNSLNLSNGQIDLGIIKYKTSQG